MSSITIGESRRVQSQMKNDVGGMMTPEEVLVFTMGANVTGSAVLFYNTHNVNKFKITDIRERHVTVGTNPITLRIQDASVVAPPSQANTGTTIYTVASIPTTSTANTWQRAGGTIQWAGSPGNNALGQAISPRIVGPGDSLIIDVPATVATFTVQVMGVWV